MAPRVYRNFDLVIERASEGFDVHVVESPAGEAHGTFTSPFGPHELENFILKMGARRGVRRAGSAPRSAAREFGQALYGAVFTPDVEYALRQSLQDCQSRGEGLRLRLRLHKAPELMDLPWEYLHSSALGRPLALSVDTPLVRYMDMGMAVEALEVELPLRILVVMASPSDIEELDTDRELANLRDATAELVRDGRIEIHALASPTVEDLQHQLRKDAFHILHFMGHGIFDESTGIGMLAFEDGDGRARPVAGADLGMMLHDHRGLQMVVLNACEGSRTSVQDPLGGVAQSLVRQGIPAVVAMQFEISDAAAKRFSRELYLAIADGYPVDAAVSEARKALYLQDRATEWGTPVLHLRAADGHIFDLQAAAKPAEVPILMEEVEARAVGDAHEEISAIGILQRILAIDPDNQAAAEQLARLQASARRDRNVVEAASTDRNAATLPDADADADPDAGPDLVPNRPAAGTADAAPDDPPIQTRRVPSKPPTEESSSPPSSPTPAVPAPPTPSAEPTPSGPVAPRRDDGSTFPVVSPASTGPASTGPASTGPASTEPASTEPDGIGADGPWPKRIGIGVVAAVALVFGFGVMQGIVGDDDAPTQRPTSGSSEFATEIPTDRGDPLAWYADVALLTTVAVAAPTAPVIDAVLDDWPADGFTIGINEVVHGDHEVDGVGVVIWDADALYVSAIVNDSSVSQPWAGNPSQLWRGDSVSFEWSRSPANDPDATVTDGDLHVLLGPDDGANGVLAAANVASNGVFRAGGTLDSVVVASRLVDGGYHLETTIPWQVLGGVVEVGEIVGFNLNISNGTGDADFSSMTSSTLGRTSPNQPHSACWGRMLMWDDPNVAPAADQLPQPADAAPC